MRNYPKGVNFEKEVLQFIARERKVDENFSRAVNRLLKVAKGCKETDHD